jgi:hypothetical protein
LEGERKRELERERERENIGRKTKLIREGCQLANEMNELDR